MTRQTGLPRPQKALEAGRNWCDSLGYDWSMQRRGSSEAELPLLGMLLQGRHVAGGAHHLCRTCGGRSPRCAPVQDTWRAEPATCHAQGPGPKCSPWGPFWAQIRAGAHLSHTCRRSLPHCRSCPCGAAGPAPQQTRASANSTKQVGWSRVHGPLNKSKYCVWFINPETVAFHVDRMSCF